MQDGGLERLLAQNRMVADSSSLERNVSNAVQRRATPCNERRATRVVQPAVEHSAVQSATANTQLRQTPSSAPPPKLKLPPNSQPHPTHSRPKPTVRFKEKLTRAKDMEIEDLPVVLVGNKCDLEDQRQVPRSEGEDLAKVCSWLTARFELGRRLLNPTHVTLFSNRCGEECRSLRRAQRPT